MERTTPCILLACSCTKFLVCYLLLGATIFQLLEKQAESQSRDRFQFEKLRFLENYTCLDQQAVEQFVQVEGRG